MLLPPNREDAIPQRTDALNNVIDFESKKRERQQHTLQMGAKLRIMVEEARAHPLGLYRLCFTDDFGEPIILKWFHKEWADTLLKNTHCMLEAPRGCSKTTFLLAMALWFIGNNPDIRVGIVCGNDTNAAKRLAEIKSHIEKDPLYQLVFPGVKLDNKQKNDSLNLNVVRGRHTKDYTVEARGVMGDGTGDRKDLFIFDDVCNYKNTIQEPATRPKVLAKVRGDWLSCLNPRGGRAWFIFTPWHAEDANNIMKIESKGRWFYRRYAHGKPGDPYHSIFPELFGRAKLKWLRKDIGALEYARAYLCKALSSDMQVVRAEWLHEYGKYDITSELLNRACCILSIDPMGGKREGRRKNEQDYMGISVFLVDLSPDNPMRPKAHYRIFLVEAFQLRLSTAHAARLVAELHHRWKPDATIVEAQGLASLHEWVMKENPHIKVLPVPAVLSKKQRLESVTPMLQHSAQHILIHPRCVEPDPQEFAVTIGGDDPTTAMAKRMLRGQWLDFPTTHDDVSDSTVQGLRYISQWVIPLSEGMEAEDHAPDIDFGVRSISF